MDNEESVPKSLQNVANQVNSVEDFFIAFEKDHLSQILGDRKHCSFKPEHGAN